MRLHRILLVVVLALISTAAIAHIPVIEETDSDDFSGAVVIPRIYASFAIYAALKPAGDIDYYTFNAEEPYKVHAGILVPYRESYRDFYPNIALAGKDLPPPQEALPFELPEGHGAVVAHPVNQGENRERFHEPFSNTDYFRTLPYIDEQVQGSENYFLIVWHPEDRPGSYVLVFGKGEKWKYSDLKSLWKKMKIIKSGSWIIDID